jgi:DNA (cytosine-5)-methyltransferase 1
MGLKEKRPLVVSLFTGSGGLDLGLDAAGFHTIYASDIDPFSVKTLEMGREAAVHLGKPFLEEAAIECADVRNLNGSDVLTSCGLIPGELDMLAGGPPCQAFSVFGRRKGKEDPRGMLAWEFIRLLGELVPKSFLFENVSGLLTIDEGKAFDELCGQLKSPLGETLYTIKVFRLNAIDYGVPQYRDRVFILGLRGEHSIPDIPAICGAGDEDLFNSDVLTYRTVVDGLRGLPPLGSTDVCNHTSRKHSQRIIDRYAAMSPGERDKHTRINKLDLTRPSFTIIVGSDAGGGKGHVHPIEPREVSPRESARMQTFPDWWAFSGKGRHPIRQVGNAVPPLLAALVGKHILKNFFNQKDRTYRQIIEYLSLKHLFSESDLLKLEQMENAHYQFDTDDLHESTKA